MEQLEYFMSFWEFSNERAIELADRLVSLAPDGVDHVYFTSGGSEGNEAAIKMARYYHHRRGEGERTWILARDQAYHGVGYGAGRRTGFPIYHEGFGPMLPHVRAPDPAVAVPQRAVRRRGPDRLLPRASSRHDRGIGADRIAAMIGEPIMGVAGMIVPPGRLLAAGARAARAPTGSC